MEQFNEPPEKALTMWLISVRVPSALNGTTTLSDRDLSGVRRCVSMEEYAPGVKLICGAYHPPETTSYIGLSRDDVHLINQNSLVYSSKAGTDTCSNTCVLIMVHTIMDDVRSSFVQTPRLGILFGSWNTQSAEPILHGFVKNESAREEGGKTSHARWGGCGSRRQEQICSGREWSCAQEKRSCRDDLEETCGWRGWGCKLLVSNGDLDTSEAVFLL
ncbi:hypothetical protein EDD17DRAFT_903559 [Pisolithus thermaeus]|nr:hypothetical protein EDD17DRAFT_903559 [Pisolithus thermaeus]